jgi:hypothetical protein
MGAITRVMMMMMSMGPGNGIDTGFSEPAPYV